MVQVRNRKVWNQVRIIFMGSAVLFLINIYFGFDNAFTSGLLPRAQALIHLHAGSIGWITLSLIGLAICIFTGEREVSDSYVSRVRALTYGAIGIFGAYIVSFGIAYSRGGGYFALLPIFGLLLAAGLVTFLIRTGRRALAYNPRRGGIRAWTWFGSLWVVMFVLLFIFAAVSFAEDISASPFWFYVVFSHTAFVGMMTNLLLGVYALRTASTKHVVAWGEPVSMWLINLGLLVFFTLKIAADIRLGAIVMGIGVLLGVGTMLLRLRADRSTVPAAARAASAD